MNLSSLLFISCLLAATAFAVSGKVDLTTADNIMCRSPGMGNFYLASLKDDPHFFRSSKTPIKIKQVSKNAIIFKYKHLEGQNYTLLLQNSIQHQDYLSHEGFLINGDIEYPVDCVVE